MFGLQTENAERKTPTGFDIISLASSAIEVLYINIYMYIYGTGV
jgi:hypothetical protein